MKKNSLYTIFNWKKFSKNQAIVLSWWTKKSKYKDLDIIIADGAVRSGKTLSMSLSFCLWAMYNFNNETFGLAGKTVGSFRRNVSNSLKRTLRGRGFSVEEKRTENLLIISKGNRKNQFFIFGGKDEGSQDLIQGITLAGMFFDEVALMPESFVNQAVARCSVEGSKLWFNCNPSGPYHYFKTGWIDKAEEKNALYLHFDMDDNPSLSEKMKERYRGLFSGIFYKRFIEGLWVLAEGIIYDMFSENLHCIEEKDLPPHFDYYLIAADYGTVNPTAFLKAGILKDEIYILREYYYDSKKKGRQKTDGEYSKDLKEFDTQYGREPKARFIAVDPSAASFINQLRKDGNFFNIKSANNEVLNGIRNVSTALQKLKIKVVKKNCPELLREFSSYVWDEKAQIKGEDTPIKQNDHVLDALRYLVHTFFKYTKF